VSSRLIRPISSLASVLLLAAPASASIIFVDIDQTIPTASQTGATWATAFTSLQSALAVAGAGDEIWVAEGFYKPTSTTDRAISFVISSDVKLFGGFKGNEVNRNDRDVLLRKTVLTGDIGAFNNASDNSFHVVRLNGNNSLVSGFHIIGGNANGGGSNNLGGGVIIQGTNTDIHECRFYGNQAAVAGAAILSITGGVTRIVHCIVTENQGSPSTISGGAIELQNGTPGLFGCVILNNPSGGAVRFLNTTGSEILANCIIRGNVGAGSTLEGQVQILSGVSVVANGNNIEGVTPSVGSSTIDADPKFADPAGPDGIPNNGDDNYALRGDSPCIDRGTSGAMPADAADVDGDGITAEAIPFDMARVTRRIEDPLATLNGNGLAPYPDMGAFEYARPRTILVNHAATGANNGTSWTNAYTDLQSAIAELTDIKFGGPGEIWVAKGTYKPSQTGDQSVSFQLPKNVKIFGGFAGGELSRAARLPGVHQTILSGEMGAAGPAGNSRTVVSAQGNFIDENTILDGFTITGGVSSFAPTAGSGVNLSSDAHPTISGCRIVGNSSSVAAPVFVNGFGSAEPTFLNCVIAGNTATGNAGPGIIFTGSSGQLLQCVVAGNTGTGTANPAVRIINAPAKVRGSVIFANTAGNLVGVPAQISTVGTTPVLTFLGVQDWTDGAIPGVVDTAVFDCGSNGDMIDPNGADNVFGTTDDNYGAEGCSALLDASSTQLLLDDVGDLDDDGVTTEEWSIDLLGNNRIVDLPAPNVVVGASGRIDIGPIEATSQTVGDPDLNNDGTVDASDLAILLGAWNGVGSSSDLNGDCVINAADLAILLGAWS
jgi:parallel beta-helix repeat protein